MCGPKTSNFCITQELVTNTESRPHSKSLHLNLHFNKFTWGSICTQKIGKYCCVFCLFGFFGHAVCGILVPQSGVEPIPLQWKHGVLTTGPPGNSLESTFLKYSTLLCSLFLLSLCTIIDNRKNFFKKIGFCLFYAQTMQFWCATGWFDICIYCKMVTTISLVNICHHI